MFAVPADAPVITPVVAPTVATDTLLLLHVPPLVISDKEVVDPAQNDKVPDIPIGTGFTVITLVALAVPQPPVTVYVAVSTPTVTPVTTFPAIVAFALLMLHVPPLTASVSAMFAPVITVAAPVIVPADVAFTVTTCIA